MTRPCTCGDILGHLEDCGSLTTVEEDMMLEALDKLLAKEKKARAAIEDCFDPKHSARNTRQKERRLYITHIWPLLFAAQDVGTAIDEGLAK